MPILLAACDISNCPSRQTWDNEDPDYEHCPEGWGYLLLSDSRGELQAHHLCPSHLPLAWNLFQ